MEQIPNQPVPRFLFDPKLLEKDAKQRDFALDTIQDLYSQLATDLSNLSNRQSFLQKATEYLVHKSECFVCKFPDLVAEALILFADDGQSHNKLYLQKLSFCLATCTKCLKMFYDRQFDCINKYEQSVQLDLYSAMTCWSISRLNERFALNLIERDELQWSTFLLEILMNPILIFSNEQLHESFVSLVSGAVEGYPAGPLKEIFVGEFLFFFHQNPAIRKWALGSVSTSTDRRLKGRSQRSLEFVSQCLRKLLLSDQSLPHLMTDSIGKVKLFCYILLYGFGADSFYFKDVFPFSEWFAWFLPQAHRLLVSEATSSKIIFRGLMSCFNFELEAIIEGDFVDAILNILRIGFPTSCGPHCKENVLSFDALGKAMDSIFYPTIIKFFLKSTKLGLAEVQDKILDCICQLIKGVSLEVSTQLRVLLYGCLKYADIGVTVALLRESTHVFLQDMSRYSNSNQLNMSAGQLLYDLHRKDAFQPLYRQIFNSLFSLEDPCTLPAIVHLLLWKEFGKHFVQFVNESDDAIFIRYIKYFTSIAVSLLDLPIDEYLTQYDFVFSLTLLLNSPIEIIRSVTVKTCVKKLGFIAQSYIYSNATVYILDSVLELSKVRFANQPDFSGRFSEFLGAFAKSVDLTKAQFLAKACVCFWIFFNAILSDATNETKLLDRLLDILCNLFVSLLGCQKESVIDQFTSFEQVTDPAFLTFKLENYQNYFHNIVNLLKYPNLQEKCGDLLCLLCKLWLRLRIQLSNTTISHIKILLTSSEALHATAKKGLRSFIDEYDRMNSSAAKFSLSAVPNPVVDFSQAFSDDHIPITVGRSQEARLHSQKSISMDDLSEFGKKPSRKIKHVVDLTKVEPVPKKLNTNYSVQLSQMKDIGKEFTGQELLSSIFDKQPSSFKVEIHPNLSQPHRTIKLLEGDNEYQDPVLKTTQSVYEKNTKQRLYCDLSPLFRIILGWDHTKLEQEKILFTNENRSKQVFSSYAEYEEMFEPWLLMEAKAQICRSIEEMEQDVFQVCHIISVSHINEFTDLLFDCPSDALRIYSENDYLIIQDDRRNSFAAFVTEILPKFGHFEMKLRALFTRNTRMLVPELREGTEWKLSVVCNLVTIIREYQALKGLPYFPVKDFILTPFFNPLPEHELASRAESLQQILDLNHSQAVAVAASVANSSNPFTLIQGPPGTGKTKTIQSIIGLILGPKESDASEQGLRHLPRNGRKSRQILLCAPSNAAVDEVVRRIHLNGLINERGEKFFPSMVRFGTQDSIHEDVKDVTLEVLTERRIGQRAIEQCDQLREQIKQLEHNLKSSTTDSMDDIRSREAKQLLQSKRNELRNALKKLDETKQNLRSKFLSESDIICCTLSGSGHDSLAKLDPFFDTVIIDEACQCVETSSLIPMKYKCRSCILVGDPNQLPPTILSSKASHCSFETSLFQRVQSVVPESVYLLSVQYRMHPDISRFPSIYFYSGKLQDGPNVGMHPDFQNERVAQPFIPFTKAYGFFNVMGKEEVSQLKSYKNVAEAEAAVAAVKILVHIFDKVNFYRRIGIITPYKQQQFELKRRFVQEFGKDIVKAIDINTVDAFQGQEKDIIIFSCVRAGSSVGFLADTRRLNVALTRAKSKVFILGNSHQLIKNMLWENLISDAKERGCLFDINLTNTAKPIKTVPSTAFIESKSTQDELKSLKRLSAAAKVEKFVIAKPTSRT